VLYDEKLGSVRSDEVIRIENLGMSSVRRLRMTPAECSSVSEDKVFSSELDGP